MIESVVYVIKNIITINSLGFFMKIDVKKSKKGLRLSKYLIE